MRNFARARALISLVTTAFFPSLRTRVRLTFLLVLALALMPATSARGTTQSLKKGMWGPAMRHGQSLFPVYRDLGVGLYQDSLRWDLVATRRPARPTDATDPAYQWPAELDWAVREAGRNHMRVSLQVTQTPRWANGGRPRNWAPTHAADYAAFVQAASRHYPSVHLWMIWGEPTRQDNFAPEQAETRRGAPLTRRQARAPHRYAQILDAAYSGLKRANRRNLVIGGNSFLAGDITPLNWIKNLRLPNGKAPRMDMYGHNPFGDRKPDLRKRPSRDPQRAGFADFSDLDTLAGWLDRYQRPRQPGHPRLKLFVSEYTIPTDHSDFEFNFWVDRGTQADWIKAAFSITRHTPRIYTTSWIQLFDDDPSPSHDERNHGLLDYRGNPKPGYRAFRRG